MWLECGPSCSPVANHYRPTPHIDPHRTVSSPPFATLAVPPMLNSHEFDSLRAESVD